MSEIPATATKVLDEISQELEKNKEFINEKGKTAVITYLRMLFSDETIFGNITKPFIVSFVSNVDKNLTIVLAKNIKEYGLTFSNMNLLLTIIDGKLVAFLSRSLNGSESKAWYEKVGRPQSAPTVR